MEPEANLCSVEDCEQETGVVNQGVRAGKPFKYCFAHSQEKKAQYSGSGSPSRGSVSSPSDNLGAQVGNAITNAVRTSLQRAPDDASATDFLKAVKSYAENYVQIGNDLKEQFGKKDEPEV